ncbi:MAG: BamA/TamA family outer membrane protein, partial [Bryobacteraceae bacterium]
SVGSDRVRLRVQTECYLQQWNHATLAALEGQSEVPGIYRTRHNFEPTVAITIARPLTLTAGVSFQRFETQFPAARTESAHAVVNTLRYHRTWEGLDAQRQSVDAGYDLRAATTVLGSDFAYARHTFSAGYETGTRHQSLAVRFAAGRLGGRAPLFERFVLGNSSTLRGWNRLDVAPLGGNRMAHNSVEYRYRVVKLFYDAGAVWSRGQSADTRHGAGIGLRLDGFTLALAFPIKEGRAEPIFMAGMNF